MNLIVSLASIMEFSFWEQENGGILEGKEEGVERKKKENVIHS